MHCNYCFSSSSSSSSSKKMDINQDGVVTIDEFIDCCQKVWLIVSLSKPLFPKPDMHDNATVCAFVLQDENIMQSLKIFDNAV